VSGKTGQVAAFREHLQEYADDLCAVAQFLRFRQGGSRSFHLVPPSFRLRDGGGVSQQADTQSFLNLPVGRIGCGELFEQRQGFELLVLPVKRQSLVALRVLPGLLRGPREGGSQQSDARGQNRHPPGRREFMSEAIRTALHAFSIVRAPVGRYSGSPSRRRPCRVRSDAAGGREVPQMSNPVGAQRRSW